MEILTSRDAFLLPPRPLRDELIEAYFTWIAPIVPVIDENHFMRQYKSINDPPSMLLSQTVLMAGSRACRGSQFMKTYTSACLAAHTFYQRAEALYEAGYEGNRTVLVQSLILLGWYWQDPHNSFKNALYWTRLAITVAQGAGMHRNVDDSNLPLAEQRLWKRIWWTLYTRDRTVAVAFEQPVYIKADDMDVALLTESDFLADVYEQQVSPPASKVLHAQFFIQWVELCHVISKVLSQVYPLAPRRGWTRDADTINADMALAKWLQQCPQQLHWEGNRHNFWAALLYSKY